MTESVKLFVDTSSWHYRYYCYIRKLYGDHSEQGKMSSLCPYFQTIILGSLLFAITLPLQALGWFGLKVCRWSYRLLETAGVSRIVDLVDDSILGKSLETSDEDLETSLFLTLIGWGFFTLMTLLAVFSLSYFVLGLAFYGLMSLPKIPLALYWTIMLLGWSVIQILYGITYFIVFLLSTAWLIVASVFGFAFWFFTTKWIWESILYYTCVIFCVTGGCVVVSYGVMKLLDLPIAKKFLDFVMLKFNGYHEAREKAIARRQAEKAKVKLEKVEESPVDLMARVVEFVHSVYQPMRDFFVSKSVRVRGAAGKALSAASIVGMSLWAIKKRACPIIEFVDLNDDDNCCAKNGCGCHHEGSAELN